MFSSIYGKICNRLLSKHFVKKLLSLKICESFYIKSDCGIILQNKMVYQNKFSDMF